MRSTGCGKMNIRSRIADEVCTQGCVALASEGSVELSGFVGLEVLAKRDLTVR